MLATLDKTFIFRNNFDSIEIYGEGNVAEIIEQTKKILKWIENELEK